jgi:alkylhydroperoxidase/carboxymuconolactone decarboxylase family protein YurZ
MVAEYHRRLPRLALHGVPFEPAGRAAQFLSATRIEQMSDYAKRRKRGMAILKKMGRENLMLEQKALCPELYDISVGHLFGDVWARKGLSLRERQLVTLAANIAMARPTGNYSHYRSAQHIGITQQEICEVIIQVGHYAGWPTISNAVRQYTAVLEEDEAIKQGKKKKPTLV